MAMSGGSISISSFEESKYIVPYYN
jgi:hypothetical protein